MIDTKEIKAIPLEQIFYLEGENPCRKAGQGFYKSPFVRHLQASGTLQIRKNNKWKCWATGLEGSVIDFIIEKRNLDFLGACNYLLQMKDIKTPQATVLQQAKLVSEKESEKGYFYVNDIPLFTYFLKGYAMERGISEFWAKQIFRELHYAKGDREGQIYKALAIQNVHGGFEFRNKYLKGNTYIKDVTCIASKKENDDSLSIFEGMFDYASACVYYNKLPTNNVMILHSTSFFSRVLEAIQTYDFGRVYWFGDNDETGKLAFSQIEYLAENMSAKIFPNHKDFNEFLTSRQ
jgi:hypothetical protein